MSIMIYRYKNLVIIALACIVLMCCLSCTTVQSSQKPQWIDTLYDAKYPEKTYMCAIGTGSTRENAVQAALSSLSQVFHARIESTQSFISSSTSFQDSSGTIRFTETDALFDQGIISSTTERIIGAQVVNTWIDPQGFIWVRVALDREKSARITKGDMEALQREIASVRMSALPMGDPLRKFFALYASYTPSVLYDGLTDQLYVLTGELRTKMLPQLLRELDDLASKIPIAINVSVISSPDVLTEGAILQTKRQLASAYASLLSSYGFPIVEREERGMLTISYAVSPVLQQGSPYSHARYELSIQLTEGKDIFVSYQKSERVTALSEEAAKQQALRAALLTVSEFASQLER